MLINPTFEEILAWNHQWDTLRLFVMKDFVVFASGYGWTHHDIVVQLKGTGKRYPSGLAAIAYCTHGRVRYCINDETDDSGDSYRKLCAYNPDFAQIAKDFTQLRESL